MIARTLAATGFVVALLALTPPVASAAEDYRMFTSKSGRYKVKFPARAELTEEVEELKDGPQMHMLTAVVKGPNGGVWSVAYLDPPKSELAGIKKDLKAAKDTFGGSEKIISSQPIDLGEGVTARERVVMIKATRCLRSRWILKGPRLYVVGMLAGNEKAVTGEDADMFFDSFELLD